MRSENLLLQENISSRYVPSQYHRIRGPMLAGHVRGQKRSLSSMFEAVGSHAAGTMTEEEVREYEEKNTIAYRNCRENTRHAARFCHAQFDRIDDFIHQKKK